MQPLDQQSAAYQTSDLRRGVDHIGIGCIFFCHDGQGNVLLHKRGPKCRDEQGVWDCGAGSMEFGESFEDTVRREVREEYGVEPIKVQQVGAKSAVRTKPDGTKTHWVQLLHYVQVDPQGVVNGEPEKIEELGWFPLDAIPEPMHSQLSHDLEMLRAWLVRDMSTKSG